MPAIVTTAAGNNSCLFGLTPKQLRGVLTGDDDGVVVGWRWEIIGAPVGSAATLSSPSAQNTTFVPDIPGDYEFQLCTDFELPGQDDADMPPAPSTFVQILCPKGMIAGQEVYIPLSNCPPGSTVTWSANGALISVVGDTTGATVLTDPDGGTVTVGAVCSFTDASGQMQSTSAGCFFESFPQSEITSCEASTPVAIDVVQCGTYCTCTRRTITVKAFDPLTSCQTSDLKLTVKECPETVEEVCE